MRKRSRGEGLAHPQFPRAGRLLETALHALPDFTVTPNVGLVSSSPLKAHNGVRVWAA